MKNETLSIDDGEGVNVGWRYRVGGYGGDNKKWDMRGW